MLQGAQFILYIRFDLYQHDEFETATTVKVVSNQKAVIIT